MVDVEPAFVSDGESAKSVDPREAAFDDPSVAAELLAGLDASPRDTWLDLTTAAGTTAATVVISLVGVQLVWSASRSAALACNGRDRVKQVLERHAVVDVGPGQEEGERETTPICDQVTFGAGPASICRVRTGGNTPLFAAIDELSTQARLQSMRSASRNLRSSS